MKKNSIEERTIILLLSDLNSIRLSRTVMNKTDLSKTILKNFRNASSKQSLD